MQKTSGEISFKSYSCPADMLVTARSHLVDRFVPDCEIVHLPPKEVGGGAISYEQKDLVAEPEERPKQKLARLLSKPNSTMVREKLFIDFRLRTPQNWAHFLNNHLPILFAIANEASIDPSTVLVVLPANAPKHILGAAELFGLETLCTDGPVEGRAIAFVSEPWTGIRSVRADWARLPFAQAALDAAGFRNAAPDELPERVFISRRNTRNLENEHEVEAFLKNRGYRKVYPEDLSVAEQFKLFEHSERIVSIHGAAVAPLLYRSQASKLHQLIELFPCGHMTDVYRVMSHQVGCDWIGVRGKIKPEHVNPAYDLETPYLKFSLQSFEVDLSSLERAMDISCHQQRI